MVRLTDRHDMTLDVYRGRKITMQQQQQIQTEAEYIEYGHSKIVYFRLPPSISIGCYIFGVQ